MGGSCGAKLGEPMSDPGGYSKGSRNSLTPYSYHYYLARAVLREAEEGRRRRAARRGSAANPVGRGQQRRGGGGEAERGVAHGARLGEDVDVLREGAVV